MIDHISLRTCISSIAGGVREPAGPLRQQAMSMEQLLLIVGKAGALFKQNHCRTLWQMTWSRLCYII